MTLKLISFTTCPFVQRAALMLAEKDAPFDVEYIDLKKKPDWFLKISPRGKVPLLDVEGRGVLFESHAICEYIDETIPNEKLTPDDAIDRARARAWFGLVGEDLLMPIYRIETARDDDAFNSAKASIKKTMAKIDEDLGARPFLTEGRDAFGLADVAIAPALFRLVVLRERFGVDLLTAFKNLDQLAVRLMARPSMARSVPPSFYDDQRAHMLEANAVILKRA